MIVLKNIHSLSDFLRNAKARIASLKRTGAHAILTVNGEAELVVLSAEAYQELVEELELQKTLNAAHQGALESLRTGEVSAGDLIAEMKPSPDAVTIPAEEYFAQLRRKAQQRSKRKAS